MPKIPSRPLLHHNITRIAHAHQLLNRPLPKAWQLHKIFDKLRARRLGQLPTLVVTSSKYGDDIVLESLLILYTGHCDNVPPANGYVYGFGWAAIDFEFDAAYKVILALVYFVFQYAEFALPTSRCRTRLAPYI
jgi:hypothetical protein